ncbi:MAG: VOC family protein [Acidimicrobiales bacterium]
MSSLLTEIVIESTDPARAAAFWSAALGWELREYQPGNVTWMSASGDPEQHDLKLVFVRARDGNRPANRLYLNPFGCELADEVERLRKLGATKMSPTDEASTGAGTPWVALVDPGGTGLTVLASRVD